MMKQYLFYVMGFFATLAHAQHPTLDYVKALETDNVTNNIFIEAVKSLVDESGNLYLVGNFRGDVDVDPGDGEDILTKNTSSYFTFQDFFVAKYSASGVLLWAHNTGGTAHAEAHDLALTEDGVIVSGLFLGTVDFDPSAGTSTGTASTTYASGFVVQYDQSDGDFDTVNFVEPVSSGGARVSSCRISVSDDGSEIFAYGNFKYKVEFPTMLGNYSVTSQTSSSQNNVYYAELNSSLEWQNANGVLDEDPIEVKDLEFDSSNVPFLALEYDNNPSTETDNIIAVLKYGGFTPTTVLKLTRTSTSFVSFGDMLLDATDSLVVVGYFREEIYNHGGLMLSDTTTPYGNNGYILKASSSGSGTVGWSKSIDLTAGSIVNFNTVDEISNGYLVSGGINGTADLDPGTGTYTISDISSATYNSFMAEYSPVGDIIWGHVFESTNKSRITNMPVDGGDFYIFGDLDWLTEFDPDPSQSTTLDITNGSRDFYFAKYADYVPPSPGKGAAATVQGDLLLFSQGNDMYRVQLYSPSIQPVSYTIYNLLGQPLLHGTMDGNPGRYESFMDLSGWATGAYILEVQDGVQRFTRKFLIE